MIRSWNHFSTPPVIVNAEKNFWKKHLSRNLDKVVRILVNISDNTKCVVCGDYSLYFKTCSGLTSHIKNHKNSTIEYCLENIISKSPDDLDAMMGGKHESPHRNC